jgi:hypothetical protein
VPGKEERVYLTPARVPASYSGEAHWKWISGEFRWSLALEKSRTVFRTARGSRKRERCRRSFPGAQYRGGWSDGGGRVTSVVEVLLDLLQTGRGEQVREGRLGEVKEIEERGRAGVHWRRRNQPKMPTGICRLRREMSTAWRRLRLREERGKLEGVSGYL